MSTPWPNVDKLIFCVEWPGWQSSVRAIDDEGGCSWWWFFALD